LTCDLLPIVVALPDAAEVAGKLAALRQHLETMGLDKTLKQLKKVHPGYVRLYDMAQGDRLQLEQLASRFVLDGVDIHLIVGLLDLFKKTAALDIGTADEFFRATVLTLARLVGGNAAPRLVGLDLHNKPADQLLQYLRNALSSAFTYARKGKKQALLNSALTEALQQFCDGSSTDVKARVEVYKALATTNGYAEDAIENRSKFYQAQSLVKTHWDEHIGSAETLDGNARSRLFLRLLSTEPTSAVRAAGLAEIMLLWEEGGVSNQQEAWTSLFLQPQAWDESAWPVLVHPEQTRRNDGNLKCTRWVSLSEEGEMAILRQLLSRQGENGGGSGGEGVGVGEAVESGESSTLDWMRWQAGVSFGLTSRYASAFEVAAAALAQATELSSHRDGGRVMNQLFVEITLTTAVLPSTARSCHFNGLIDAMMHAATAPSSRSINAGKQYASELWDVDRVARQLYAAGCWSEAGWLLMRSKKMPSALRTLDMAATLVAGLGK
jgi:hypothetical protein